jgi:hypothetical protein
MKDTLFPRNQGQYTADESDEWNPYEQKSGVKKDLSPVSVTILGTNMIPVNRASMAWKRAEE